MTASRKAVFKAVTIVGMPGSGKGTQGKALGALPGYYYFGMGDALRALDAQTDLGREVRGYMTRGALVAGELTLRIWQEAMVRAEEEGRFNPAADVVLLDGLPRNEEQARLLAPHVEIQRVLHLRAEDENELVRRLLKRARETDRPDEDEETIRRRFEVYRERTAPVLAQYPQALVVEIAALQPPLQVLADVVAALGKQVGQKTRHQGG